MLVPVLFLLISGCIGQKEVIKYLPVDSVPDQYPDGSFSVKGFLAVKDSYDDQLVSLKGIIERKNECAPCPKKAVCKPCPNSYILLADPVKEITSDHEILINFFKDRELYDSFLLGQQLTIQVKYNSNNLGGIGNLNGYFVYDGLSS